MKPAVKTTSAEGAFPLVKVLTVAFGHFVHDTFSAFLGPLLPWLIEKFGLSYTQAGSLTAFLQAPSALNPFIGYLSDRLALRYFVALAPAVTATGMVLMGVMPGYGALAALLLVTGFSVASFHAPAPALVAHLAPRQAGRGMSFFMAGGEMGRVVGPLLAVWAVGLWGLEGLPRLLVLGWGASLLLLWQVRRLPARMAARPLRELWPVLRRLALPLVALTLGRSFLLGAMQAFLPTYLSQSGLTKTMGGVGYALLYELPGVLGALVVGPLSDRIGRSRAIVGAVVAAAAAALAFLFTPGLGRLFWLPVLGFTALSVQPVMLALVQDYAPGHRATANGAYLGLSFVARPLAVTTVGALADLWSLRWAFVVSALVALLSLLALPLLPRSEIT